METQTIYVQLYKALEKLIEDEATNGNVKGSENEEQFSETVKQIIVSNILRDMYTTSLKDSKRYLRPIIFYALKRFYDDDVLQQKYPGLPEHVLNDIFIKYRDLNPDPIGFDFYPLVNMLRNVCDTKDEEESLIQCVDQWLYIHS